MTKARSILHPGARLVLLALFTFHFSLFTLPLRAISVGTTETDTSPEAELKSFTVLDGFEVSLFASEKDGVAKPISMRWDERGRLWVITAQSYPQPQPGEVCNDKILILEDTKHTGHADKITVFADGLRMPTGIELAPSATWPQQEVAADVRRLKSPDPASPQSQESQSLLTSAATAHPMAAYIGEGEKLLILRDLDGDGHADVKEVVFSGFGTGDMHQCLNSFTWTPDGALMFSQGLHNYSNVTTPWGGRRLYGAGFWMYRPLRAQLTPYPTGFPLNAWGTVYDDAGQPFTVAGAAGMFWTTPLLVPQYGDEAARSSSASVPAASVPAASVPSYSVHLIEGRALPNQGQIVKQGMLKYCGIDIPRNAHWPADMHGELVSGGFFENCIYRHKLQQDKANPSGYEAVRQPNLITSSSVAFRPVDVKFGPDGALYISDWYNPIIGHYQASFRHPDRDKTHGRIWRVVKKGSPLVEGVPIRIVQTPSDKKEAQNKAKSGKGVDLVGQPRVRTRGGPWMTQDRNGNMHQVAGEFMLYTDLNQASTNELLDVLEHGDRWAQYQAQRLLMGRPKDEVIGTAWKPKDTFANIPSRELEKARISLQAHNWFEVPSDWLVSAVRGAPKNSNPRHDESDMSWQFRCEGVRSVGLWQHKVEKAYSQLELSVADDNPRVRLEAVAACAHLPEPLAMQIALRALDKPMDSFLDRTLELTVHALAPQWEPALREGKLTLPPKHLAWLLDKKSDGDTLARIRTTLHDKPATFDPDSRRALLLMLAKRGSSEDVAAALEAGEKDAALLSELADLVESQQIKAPGNAEEAVSRLPNKNPSSQSLAWTPLSPSKAKLIGLWGLKSLEYSLRIQLEKREPSQSREDVSVETKCAALIALARLNAGRDLILGTLRNPQEPFAIRATAVKALAMNDIKAAAKVALGLMPSANTEEDMRALLAPFLVKAGRAKLLVTAITETPPSKEAADLASRALAMMGRNEPELSATLNKILGRTAVVMPFDAQWVSSLANEATVAGNAKHGDEIFHRPTMACTGCHSIGNVGGIIGPQLDAVGRGVPVELLVEAVMWPQRQIKEGYVATTVVMKDGRSIVGYKSKETDTELTVRDMATKVETPLQKSQMQTRADAGSLMPDGLTASLSREELRDLIAYLASLGKDK